MYGWGRTSMRDSFSRKAPIEEIAGKAKVIGRSTFRYTTVSGAEVVRYHSTDVVVRRGSEYQLFSGGYTTISTKDRINKSLPGDFRVFSHKGKWWVAYVDCIVEVCTPFREGIVLPRDCMGDDSEGFDHKRPEPYYKGHLDTEVIDED